MEIGKQSFSNMKESIKKEDLDVRVKVGLVFKTSFGTATTLREILEKFPTEALEVVYYTIASAPLYVVNWNDLSKEKQEYILRKREKHE